MLKESKAIFTMMDSPSESSRARIVYIFGATQVRNRPAQQFLVAVVTDLLNMYIYKLVYSSDCVM